jgi:endonuclease YncB( thermonuclease family)
MKQKFLNIFTTIFLGIFCLIIFQTANSKTASSQSNYLRVKSHPTFNKNFSGNAVVLDGDSLKVDGKEVRLVGLDAPEYNQTCFNQKKEEYACGQVSRKFLLSLANGKNVKCIYSQKDKYDRFLSKCFIRELSINEELVKNGMAVIYNFTESEAKMNQLEAEAKKQKLGIWQGAFQLPKEYRKSHPRKK